MSARADVALALRGARRHPGTALVIVLTLALGIGAATAVFSVVDSVLLRPLPYAHADRLMWLGTHSARAREPVGPRFAVVEAWQRDARSVRDVAYYILERMTVHQVDVPTRLTVAHVSGDFFALLGTHAEHGRLIGPADDRTAAPPVAVLSDSVWRTTFHADPSVIGRSVTLDRLSAVVVGVAPRGLALPAGATGAWVPARSTLFFVLGDPRLHVNGAFARVRHGVSLASARAELQHIADAVPRAPGTASTARPDSELVDVVPLRTRLTGDVREPLVLVLAASLLVLVVACVNVAGMLLARGTARAREIAVCVALGAGRARVVRLLLVECAVYAAAGSALGLILAAWGVRVAATLGATLVPRAAEIGVHAPALGACVLLGAAATLLAGLWPAVHTVGRAPERVMRDGAAHATATRGGVRGREALVVMEIALTVVLLASAGALGRGVAQLLAGSEGMASGHVLVAGVMRPFGVWPADKGPMREFGRALVSKLEAQPGVRAAAVSLEPPASEDVSGYLRLAPDGDSVRAYWAVATPDYFRTLGIPVLRGRTFDTRDGPGGAPAVILSRSVAERLFGGGDPVGQQVLVPPGGDTTARLTPYTVVGVVGDVRPPGPGRAVVPAAYTAFDATPVPHMTVLVRTTGSPAAFATTLRGVVHSLDPEQPVTGIRPLEALQTANAARPRFYLAVLGAFAAVALALAVVGLYGLLSYAVRQRAREIGIRRALGARAGCVERMVVGRALALTAVGTAAGMALAWGAMRAVAGLAGVDGGADPLVLTGAVLALGAVAVAASWLPARTAARIDPVAVLRSE